MVCRKIFKKLWGFDLSTTPRAVEKGMGKAIVETVNVLLDSHPFCQGSKREKE
jgi:hypothetical protein